ncbi:hypothetical protein [Fusobacterium ulcerans]|uniref:hypothetical protein n=1 Tax=Fusobacterium ulcerans TaxID=861 RepID=UPI001D0B5D33|nr:hypothetical protein [Fusobacterium ulcerans]MCB8563900.1 hypothetical protein [Fusobacterium ulcerans]MCB8648259.1 hypothetical protein [Fusobacterium ulcerans]
MAIREIKNRFKRGADINFSNKSETKYFHYFKEEWEELYTQDVYEEDYNGELIETNFYQDIDDIIETFREALKN